MSCMQFCQLPTAGNHTSLGNWAWHIIGSGKTLTVIIMKMTRRVSAGWAQKSWRMLEGFNLILPWAVLLRLDPELVFISPCTQWERAVTSRLQKTHTFAVACILFLGYLFKWLTITWWSPVYFFWIVFFFFFLVAWIYMMSPLCLWLSVYISFLGLS